MSANTGSLREQDLSLLLILHARFRVGERDAIAALGILFGFQIADLGFALGFWFFLYLRLLVHIDPFVDLSWLCLFTGVLSQIRREVTRKNAEFYDPGT